MSYTITAAVYVDIAGVPLHTPAWVTRNPLALRKGPGVRGGDRLIPGAAGVRPGMRRAAPRTETLNLVVYGHQRWDGVPHADVQVGLDENLMHLRTNLCDPAGSATPKTATLHLPGGGTVSGAVHVELFDWDDTDAGVGLMLATLDVTMLTGSLS